MIFSLTGVPVHVEPFFAVLECGGVGYGARIPVNVYQAIVAGAYDTGKKPFSLVTRSVYSEDNAQLFGFLDQAEAQLFDFIRSLHGFGPQAAMNLISTIGGAELLQALKESDVKALTKVPGVGKTRAEKLCFEANSKKARLDKLSEKTGKQAAATATQDDLLVQALVSLGYSQKEIDQAAEKIRKLADLPSATTRENLQDWIRLYLRNL
ncbi:MAG TPA: Holliday junction ATP-dependent DNA helicase RuvA [Turneriella sp.]|nr:Holliday junction ATP-dependent DNA helicase RuvA [Turneriella sp.]